jgi:hypothetical protein
MFQKTCTDKALTKYRYCIRTGKRSVTVLQLLRTLLFYLVLEYLRARPTNWGISTQALRQQVPDSLFVPSARYLVSLGRDKYSNKMSNYQVETTQNGNFIKVNSKSFLCVRFVRYCRIWLFTCILARIIDYKLHLLLLMIWS